LNNRNVIIITFDCLRPDRLGGSGYHGVSTPTFDRIMAEGTTFTNIYCQGPNTWKSHASMFTGCIPPTNGVRKPVSKISDQLQTMAELFQEAGYATYGLPALSLLSKEAGFARGFTEYRLDGMVEKEEAYSRFRTSTETLDIVNRWLESAPQPFFAWIHYFGIHWLPPEILDLPEEYRRSYSEYAQFYDGKISYTDDQFLTPLVNRLHSLGLLDKTILVLWSDHGDDLEDIELIRIRRSKSDGHNWGLSEGVMRILLTIRAPGLLPAGQKRIDLCQSIDILPTLLEMTGVAPGIKQCQGRSLLSMANQTDSPIIYLGNICRGFVGVRYGRYKFVLTEPSKVVQNQDPLTIRSRLLKDTARQMIPYRWQKYWRNLGNKQRPWWADLGEPDEILKRLLKSGVCELYDLVTDPAGKKNIAPDNPQLVHEYKEILQEIATQSVSHQSAYTTAEEEAVVEERLKSLGYL
jgi:arylsulfatase A-like enzyme